MKSLKTILINSIKKLAKNKAGFSLTELMIAMSIVGVTATAGATQFDDALAAARDARRQADMHQVELALNFYYDDFDYYPISNSSQPSETGWDVMTRGFEDISDGSPYMPEVPQDKLNQSLYVYKYWSDGKTFKISYETEDLKDKSPIVVWGL